MEHLIRRIRPEIRSEKPYLVGGFDVEHCKLNQNECPFDLPAEMKKGLLEAFQYVPFNRYPTEQPFHLMQRLEALHGCDEGSVLVGNGSNDLSQTLGLCLVSKGVEVVLPSPMFALFASVVRMHGGHIVSVGSRDDFGFDMEAVIREAASDARALTIVASPNNPTGLAVPYDDLKRLVEVAPGFVVVDEAYQEFNTEPSVVDLLDEHPNLIVMRTMSKAMGLAGLRLGYLIAHPAVTAELFKARLPFMIDRFSEAVAIALLSHPEIVADRVTRLSEGIEWIRSRINELDGARALATTTNFVLFTTGLEAGVLASELERDGIVVRNMGGYAELQGYLRVNAGTEAENKAFVAALKRILAETD